jgi:hypothetical protein
MKSKYLNLEMFNKDNATKVYVAITNHRLEKDEFFKNFKQQNQEKWKFWNFHFFSYKMRRHPNDQREEVKNEIN